MSIEKHFFVEYYSYWKWKDFGLDLIPSIYFCNEDGWDGYDTSRDTYIGFTWLCWSVELHWRKMNKYGY